MTVDVDTPADTHSRPDSTPALLAVWGDRRSIALIGGVVVIYLVVGVLDALAASIGLFPGLTPGVVVALGLLLGPIAAWGVAIGHVLTDLASGGLAFDTVVGFLSQFALAAGAYRLWSSFGIVSRNEPAGSRTISNVVEYGFVALTATTFVVAASAWGYLLVGTSTFPAFVVDTLPRYLLSALIVGSISLYSASPLVDQYGIGYPRSYEESVNGKLTPSGSWMVLIVSLGWCIAGFGVGTVFQAVELEHPHLLANRLGRWVLPVLDIAGPGGVYVQFVGGCIAIGAALWGLDRS